MEGIEAVVAQNENRSRSTIEVAKDLMGLGAAVLAIVYTAGFLIESIFLLKHGVSDITLLKPRYLSIGITFLFFISLVVVPGFLITRLLMSSFLSDETKAGIDGYWQRWSRIFKALVISSWLLVVLVGTVILIDAASYTALADMVRLSAERAKADRFRLLRASWALMPYWFAPLMGASAGVGAATFILSGHRKDSVLKVQMTVFAYLYLPIVLIFSSFAYTEHIYPYLNPAFGGGNFPHLQFVCDAKDAPIFNQLGIMRNPSDSKSLPVRLLGQSEKNYIVLLEGKGQSNVVMVDRNIVKGVISTANNDVMKIMRNDQDSESDDTVRSDLHVRENTKKTR